MAKSENDMFEFKREPIKGYPELRWAGKRPFTGTSYYPAQLKESHGESSADGWMNKLYWGDNLQVMSHLLKEYRGKIDLIYIDPPFDSEADYKKRIELRGKAALGNYNAFEEKQYGDIWSNDEYLTFMYERLILCKELLSDTGSFYLHCDWHMCHYLISIMNELFGQENFVNQVSWKRTFAHGDMGQGAKHLGRITDYILIYKKGNQFTLNQLYTPYEQAYIEKTFKYKDEDGRRWQSVSLTAPGGAAKGNPYYEFLGVYRYWQYSQENMKKLYDKGYIYQGAEGQVPRKKMYLDEAKGVPLQDVWTDIVPVQGGATENYNYPTQKPEKLLERIIELGSNPGDIVFDCFMGSGTTQSVAMKLGRRFIGADINLGAVQTTSKRLLKRAKELQEGGDLFTTGKNYYTGFEVYNVNDYEFFRNELEAKKLIIEALGMQSLPENSLWDAEMDGRMVAILGINRIATASEFEKIVANIDISSWQKKQNENPGKPVERITFVCMGHDPNLEAMFHEKMASLGFIVDLEIIDILRDKKELTFKRDADAKISIANGKLSIEQFYPMNLLQKLSFEKQDVKDWKDLVDCVMIDWNYDGVAFAPTIADIPEKNAVVKGSYDVPEDAGTIHVKITDLISESWEASFNADGSKL